MDDAKYLNASDGTGEAALAHITADRAPLATVLEVDNTDNWPEFFVLTTGAIAANNYIDPSSMTIMRCHLDGGDVIIDEFAPGYTDVGNTDDQIAIIKQATEWADIVAKCVQEVVADTEEFITTNGDWRTIPGVLSVASGYNKGNKELVLDSTVDLTNLIDPGHKVKITRGTAPNTRLLDLDRASSQYASKTSPSGLNQTDDITIEGWIQPEATSLATGHIIGRSSSFGVNGWRVYVDSTGCLYVNGGSRYAGTYQSIPFDKKTHFAISIDMSANSVVIMLDGVVVPSTALNSSGSSWTAAGDLTVGKSPSSSAEYFNGKISELRVWSTIRTATQIRDNMFKSLVGNESGLIAYFPFDGNFNDLTANANNLTPSGGALANTVDHPFHLVEYLKVLKVTATQLTLFGGTDYGVPLGVTLTDAKFSTVDAPKGFPTDQSIWQVSAEFLNTVTENTPNAGTWYHGNKVKLAMPTGKWIFKARGGIQFQRASASAIGGYARFSQSFSYPTHPMLKAFFYENAGNINAHGFFNVEDKVENTTQTDMVGYQEAEMGGLSSMSFNAQYTPLVLTAELAYK